MSGPQETAGICRLCEKVDSLSVHQRQEWATDSKEQLNLKPESAPSLNKELIEQKIEEMFPVQALSDLSSL